MNGSVSGVSSVAPSAVISIFTAIFTVALTFWFQRKIEAINILRALRTELEQNDIHGEMVMHDIFQSRDGYEPSGDERTTIPFQTSAYDRLKNSGLLAELPQNSKESIHYHYTLINTLNRRLEQREDARYHLAWQKRDGMIERIDKNILGSLIDVSDSARLEVMSENLRDNEEVEKEIAEASEEVPDGTEVGDNSPRQTFDGIIDLVDEEIDERNIFGLF
jgi:hypothetical protein